MFSSLLGENVFLRDVVVAADTVWGGTQTACCPFHGWRGEKRTVEVTAHLGGWTRWVFSSRTADFCFPKKDRLWKDQRRHVRQKTLKSVEIWGGVILTHTRAHTHTHTHNLVQIFYSIYLFTFILSMLNGCIYQFMLIKNYFSGKVEIDLLQCFYIPFQQEMTIQFSSSRL